MSNPKYAHIGTASDKLIEECSELIKAVIKGKRFGFNKAHPDNFPCRQKPKDEWCDYQGQGDFMGHTCGGLNSNLDDIKDEYRDIQVAYGQFLKELSNDS